MNLENKAGYHTAFKEQQPFWSLVLTLPGMGLTERTTSQGTLATLRILKRAVARCPTRTLVKINLFSSVMNTPLSCTVCRIWQRLLLLQIRCSSKMDSTSSTTNAASRPEEGLKGGEAFLLNLSGPCWPLRRLDKPLLPRSLQNPTLGGGVGCEDGAQSPSVLKGIAFLLSFHASLPASPHWQT